MKTLLSIIISSLLLTACVTVGSAPSIKGSQITEADLNSDSEYERLHKFKFQIQRSHETFRRYLRERYSDIKGFTPDNFRVNHNDVHFNISLVNSLDRSTHVDLSEAILEKGGKPDVGEGPKKEFIVMTVTNDKGEDCLSTNSFYRYVVINYLEDIRTGFNSY